MTIRTLFNVILKIFGLLFIKDIAVTLLQMSSIGLSWAILGTSNVFWSLGISVCILIAYGFVAFYLIFRSNVIIDILKLDKGFDQETIPLNIHRSTILSIAIIIIGGLLVVNGIPDLCRQLFAYFQQRTMTQAPTMLSVSYIVELVVKILIGLILMGEQRRIVNWIERKRKNKSGG